MYAVPDKSFSIEGAILFGVIGVASIWMLIFFFTYRIVFTQNLIVKHNFFRTTEYELLGITEAILRGDPQNMGCSLKLRIDGRTLALGNYCVGFQLLLQRLEELGIPLTLANNRHHE